MVTLHKSIQSKENGCNEEKSGTLPRTEFRVLGKVMIQKRVKTSGKTGRVYLPGDWVGKHVKIIRID